MDSGYGMYSELKQKREEALPLGKSTKHETRNIFSGWVVHTYYLHLKDMNVKIMPPNIFFIREFCGKNI